MTATVYCILSCIRFLLFVVIGFLALIGLGYIKLLPPEEKDVEIVIEIKKEDGEN